MAQPTPHPTPAPAHAASEHAAAVPERELGANRFGFGAHIADPGPLGLGGFAATTFFLSSVNSGHLSATVEGGVLGLALFYGGIAQLLAGMWEFAKGNTFGATAFGSFGAFWLSYWYLVVHVVPGLAATKPTETDVNHLIGTFLLVWTVFTAYMLIAALRTSGAIALVFAALLVTFLFLCIGAYNGDAAGSGLTEVGGYLGLITAILAWYGSFAGVVNTTFNRRVLPVMPLAG